MASSETGIDIEESAICFVIHPFPIEIRSESKWNNPEAKVGDGNITSSSPGPSQREGPGDEAVAVDFSRLFQEGELKRQTIEVHTKFGNLVSYTGKSLSERYEVDDLKAQIQQIAPNQVTKGLMDATTHDEMLCYLDEHWTWINTGILKRIIMKLGGDDDKKRLESYERKLTDYMKVRVHKLPKSIYGGEKCCRHGFQFIVKMDEEWGQFRVKDVAQTRKVIAGILGLPEDELFLLTVDKGCVKLTFQIYSASLGERLSNQQIRALKKAKVIKLILDSKVIFDCNIKRRRSRYAATITRQILKAGKVGSCGRMRVSKTYKLYAPYYIP